jgi:hypothetical protein
VADIWCDVGYRRGRLKRRGGGWRRRACWRTLRSKLNDKRVDERSEVQMQAKTCTYATCPVGKSETADRITEKHRHKTKVDEARWSFKCMLGAEAAEADNF